MGNENSHEGGQRPANRHNNRNRRAAQPQPQPKGFQQILADGIRRIEQAQAQANHPQHVNRPKPKQNQAAPAQNAQTQHANLLIQKQQETILKQQALIAQQQLQNMKLMQATQGAASADKKGGSGPNKNDKPKNQQSGGGTQLVGEYQCPLCTTQWRGNNAKIGVPKQCKKCHVDVFPQNVTSQTVSSAQVKGQSMQINVTATVVASGSADNASERRRGEYKCGQCSAKWIAFAQNGVPKECNKCHIYVYPTMLPKGSGGPNKKFNNKTELDKPQNATVTNNLNNNLNNPNQLKKCDNKKMNLDNEVITGEFRCPNCNTEWKTIWQDADQQCNKCKTFVRPWTLSS